MNLFHAAGGQREGRLVIGGPEKEPDSIAKFALELRGARATWFGSNLGRQVLVGFRPKHVSLTGAKSPVVCAIIYEQLIGAKTLLDAPFGERMICPSTDASTHPTGNEVRLSFDPNPGHIFDVATARASVELQCDIF